MAKAPAPRPTLPLMAVYMLLSLHHKRLQMPGRHRVPACRDDEGGNIMAAYDEEKECYRLTLEKRVFQHMESVRMSALIEEELSTVLGNLNVARRQMDELNKREDSKLTEPYALCKARLHDLGQQEVEVHRRLKEQTPVPVETLRYVFDKDLNGLECYCADS